MANNKGLQSIDRITDILDLYLTGKSKWGITELAHKTGLHKSIVYRILSSLEQNGFIQKDPASRKYRLGLKFFELGQVVAEELSLREIARPVMKELSLECNQTVILCVLDDLQQVCIDKIDGENLIRIASKVGARIHLHAGASAKILMAYLSPEKRREYYEKYGLPAFTKNTVTDIDELEANLARIRKMGYEVTYEERDIDLAGVAAPIYDHQARVAAGITVVGPKWSFQGDTLSHYITAAKKAAYKISQQLGYKERRSE